MTPPLADCCLVPQIFNGKRFGVNLDGLPLTMAAFDACMALPAFAQASPRRAGQRAVSGGVDAALPADWLVPDWPARRRAGAVHHALAA